MQHFLVINYGKNFRPHRGAMTIIFTLLALLLACTEPRPGNRNADEQIETSQTRLNYSKKRALVDSLKNYCKLKTPNEAGILLADFIDKQLVPYWIGTPWDFNGVSQTPGEGSIACGYLVTTILRDAGVDIHRVKMAQCASEVMINSLTKLKVNYSGLSFDAFINAVKSKGRGISIVGLDNHTGFLYANGEELYFIHSSYVGEGKVAREIAADNRILQNSHYKVVGYISQDPGFIRVWLKY